MPGPSRATVRWRTPRRCNSPRRFTAGDLICPSGGSVSLCAIGWIGHAAASCEDWEGMSCPACGSTVISERPERTAQRYRRFRCVDCGKQFNERSAGALNRVFHYPSDVIAFVVLWRLRYKLSPRDLAEMFLTREFILS